jgi:hypothetical protein
LPYESIDFDFDTIQKFIKHENGGTLGKDKNGVIERKASIDSYQTETVKDGKSQYKTAMS